MNSDSLQAYVFATAQVLGVPLTPDRCARVAEHLTRTAQMARLLETAPLAMDQELAELYLPAPFPTEGEAA